MKTEIISDEQVKALNERKPDFEGTWDVRNPEIGHYALYITEKIADNPDQNIAGFITE